MADTKVVQQLQDMIKSKPQRASAVLPRHLGPMFDEVFHGAHICHSVMFAESKFDDLFSLLCQQRSATPEKLFEEDKKAGKAAVETFEDLDNAGKDEYTARAANEHAKAKDTDDELFEFVKQGIADMTVENGWDFTRKDRAFSLGPQLIGKICLLKNTRTDDYKLGISNKAVAFEVIGVPHAKTHGFGRLVPYCSRVKRDCPEVWHHYQEVQAAMMHELTTSLEASGIIVLWASCNLWPSDLEVDSILKKFAEVAALMKPGQATAEVNEYMEPGVKRSMQKRYNIPYESVEYDASHLDAYFTDAMLPACKRLRDSGVRVGYDDSLDIELTKTDKDGAVWNANVKETSKTHLTTSERYAKHKENFDIVKLSLKDSCTSTRTGADTLAHERCAGGFVYSSHSGILAKSEQLEDRVKSAQRTLKEQEVPFVVECTATENSVAVLTGLTRALRHGFLQGLDVMETKYHLALAMMENLQSLTDVNLSKFPDSEKKEGWEEVEDWEAELAANAGLADLIEAECEAQENARLAKYEVMKVQRCKKHTAMMLAKGKGKGKGSQPTKGKGGHA